MKKRPLILIFLIISHLLGPLFSILMVSFYFDLSFIEMVKQLNHNLTAESFAFYMFYMPFLGVLLLKPRGLTFFIFVVSHLLILLGHFEDYRDLYLDGRNSYIYILMVGDIINILFLAIILKSDIRSLFFDSSLRWWESPERHQVDFECLVEDLERGEKRVGKVLNISQGGALLLLSESPAEGDIIHLTFYGISEAIRVKATVRHYFQDDYEYVGIEFDFENEKDRLSVQSLINHLKDLGHKKKKDRFG